MDSARDTNLIGATVSGNQVTATVGRDLNIASVQDTSTFKSRDQSISGSATIGMSAGAGTGGSISASRSRVDGDFASVGQQSGIEAGDGGFQINVKGNTDLKGGKIASTDQAVEQGKNSLTTGTLTSSEIQNRSQYSAESVTVSAGGSGGKPTGGAGYGSASGNETSVTRSGVSGAAVTITDAQAQQAKTGQSPDQVLASLDGSVRTGKDSSNSLAKNWNGNELREDVEAQAKITQAFGQQAAKMVGNYADDKEKELRQAASKAAQNGDQAQSDELSAEAEKWKEGGAYRAGAHAAVGLLAGGVSGAMGGAASSILMPDVAEQIKKLGLPAEVESAVSLAAAAGIGAAVGGGAGAASAYNVDLNNRQLHEDAKAKEKTLAKNLAEMSNGKYTLEQIENALRAADNKVLGETALTGAVVPYDAKAFFNIYDPSGLVLGIKENGTYVLMQSQRVFALPPLDLQSYIKNNTNNTYSWSGQSIQIPAIPVANLPSIMSGSVTPEMLEAKRNDVADAAGWVSTQSGRVGAAATAYATYLASQPNAASQTGAIIQLGIAGTATIVGFGASAFEQILRPNLRGFAFDSMVDMLNFYISERFQMFGPVATEIGESVKGSDWASSLKSGDGK